MVKNISLNQQVFLGLRYNTSAKIFEALFTVFYGLFMARMLGPSVFGVLAMASVFTGVSALLTDFGTGDAIIRHDEERTDGKFLSSIFWLNASIGLILAMVFVLLSGPIAKFFGQNIIQTIIIVNSINIVFSAMSNVPRSLIRKRLDFKSIFYHRLIILPASGVVGVIMVFNGFGIWSIVAQQIIMTTGGTILFIYFSRWIPSFILNRQHIREIFHFSSYLSATKFLNYFTKKGDLFLIGKFLGDYQLGIYSKGYQLTVQMLKTINGMIIGVLFPSISIIKDNKKKLRSIFIDVSKILFTVYGFIFLIGLFYSEQLVNLALGIKWSELAPLIPIFLLLALFFALSSIASHFLKALGETKILFNIVIYTSFFTLLAFVIGMNWGIVGVAIGYLLATILLTVIAVYKSLKKLEIPLTNYLFIFNKELLVFFISGLFMKIFIENVFYHSQIGQLFAGIIFASLLQLLYHFYSNTFLFRSAKSFLFSK